MADNAEADSVLESDAEIYPLGTSRPPLGVADLPEPEEVFKVSRLGPLQIIQFVIGSWGSSLRPPRRKASRPAPWAGSRDSLRSRLA